MSKSEAILSALGGPGNIVDVDPCMTRVRVEVSDVSAVDETALRAVGAHGIIRSATVVQVVVGKEADQLAAQINTLLG